MASWAEFAEAEPEMASLGLKQFERFPIAYLATVRKDGAPRVHPISPIIAQGRLFVATAPTSPKRHDLFVMAASRCTRFPARTMTSSISRGALGLLKMMQLGSW